jgi:hypothetical protein
LEKKRVESLQQQLKAAGPVPKPDYAVPAWKRSRDL